MSWRGHIESAASGARLLFVLSVLTIVAFRSGGGALARTGLRGRAASGYSPRFVGRRRDERHRHPNGREFRAGLPAERHRLQQLVRREALTQPARERRSVVVGVPEDDPALAPERLVAGPGIVAGGRLRGVGVEAAAVHVGARADVERD